MIRISCRLVLFLLLIFVITAQMSCSSTLPSLQNPAQSLLIVVIESHNPLNVYSGIEMSYAMNVPDCNEKIYIKQGENYAVGKNIPAGSYNCVYLTQRITDTQGGGWSTGAQNNVTSKMDVNFQVKPGNINFFPVKFVYTITQEPGGAGFQWTSAPVTKADIDIALKKFRNHKNFNQWKVDL